MQRVVRRRRTTVRITWIEQTLTESVEEVAAPPRAIAAPPAEADVEATARHKRRARRRDDSNPNTQNVS